MGQNNSRDSSQEAAQAVPDGVTGDKVGNKQPAGLGTSLQKLSKKSPRKSSLASRSSRSSCGSATDAPQQPAGAAAGYSSSSDSSPQGERQGHASPQAQQRPQQQQPAQSRPPGLPTGMVRASGDGNARQGRSGSVEQPHQHTPQASSDGNAALAAKQRSPWLDAAAQAPPGSYAASYAGSKASAGSAFSTDMKQSRASFARDNMEPDTTRSGPVRSQSVGSEQAAESNLVSLSSLRLQDAKAGSNRRSSVDSVASKASSGKRSSFALEAEDVGQQIEMDNYGRPSFAPFDSSRAARGAVFEASLPPDLAEMYRRLAVLLPQAPIPLLTILQLWGISDPREAQETVQIFVMQGVLKAATLPDGTTWLLVAPQHQQYVLADHPEKVRVWHNAVLDIYRQQVRASRYVQQQKLLMQGGPAAAAAYMQSVKDEEVLPSQFVNDGYIWLALTHHLMGAGLLDQVRLLLIDPAWLEVKLHCYGVAAVVDDFRTYLQVGSDLAVKAVLQAFQMSLSCCMERSHLPMMRNQLILRLMAAAQLASAAGATSDGNTARTSASSAHNTGPHRHSSSDSGHGIGSGSNISHKQLHLQYEQEMKTWFSREYKKSRAESSLLTLYNKQLLSLSPEQQQQQLPPHLMGYTPSLRQAGGLHRMALRGHFGPIKKVVITKDGKDVLTASDDGGVQVWDMDIGDCVLQLQPPQQMQTPNPAYPVSPSASSPSSSQGPVPLTTLAVTADGGCCLCGDAEGWLNCWSLRTGQLVHRVRAHVGRLNALAMDASGNRCITGGQDKTAKLWTLPAAVPDMNRTNSLPAGLPPRLSPALSTAGVSGGLVGLMQLEFQMTGHGLDHLNTGAVLDVAISSDGVLGVTVSDDMRVKVWDLDQQQCVATCRGHTGWVVSVQFIPETHNFVTASHDETARAWDAWGGECLGTLIGHSGRLNAVRASNDGRTVVTCSDDTTARVWETVDWTCVGVLQGHTGWVNDVALLRNGRQCVTVSGDSTARLWDTQSGKCLQVLEGHSADVACVVLTSRGRFAVTGSADGTAQVWDLSAHDVTEVEVHQGKVISVVACADGSHAASIGADGHLRLWDLLSGKCLSDQAAHASAVPQSLYLMQDGSRAYSGAGDRSLVVWDMKTGTPSVCLPAKQGSRTKFIHVSADGTSAVILLFDSSMAVYDTVTGKLRCHLMQKGERDARRVHSGGVNAVYLTSDGSRAVSVSKDCTARIWDVVTGGCELVLQGHEDSIHAAVLSPDEKLLATASFDCTVRIWDFRTGDCLRVLQHTDPVQRVAFSPPQQQRTRSNSGCLPSTAISPKQGSSSTRLVTGCDGRALWLWDVHSGACVAALGEHKEAVTAVAFSHDGRWLASTSQDRSVLVWQASTGQLAGLYVGDAAMVSCCFAARQGLKGPEGTGKGSKQLQLQQSEQDKGDSAVQDAATAGDNTVSGHTGESLVQPVGLALLVGDANGHVHFIDCL